MLRMLAAWTTSTADALSAIDPTLLGPIAGLVLALFVAEVVVSGKTYKREVDENAHLREMFAQFIPVAEEMVAVSKQMVVVTESTGRALEDFLDFMADEGVRRRR